MAKIEQVKPNYNHSMLVNYPPFITNYPMIEPRERIRREFIATEKERFQNARMKRKAINAFIWTWVLGSFAALGLSARYAYKKIKAALF